MSRRFGIPLNRGGEHRQGIVARAAPQVDISPIEQVFLSRIHVGGALKVLGRTVQIARELLHVAQQVVKLAGLFHLQQLRDDAARLVDAADLKQREREVIAVVVMCGIDGVRATQMRNGRLDVSLLQVGDGERVLRVEACGESGEAADCACGCFRSRQCGAHQREQNQTTTAGSYQYILMPICI